MAKTKKNVRPVRTDPTKSLTLRRSMAGEVKRSFAILKGAIVRLVLHEDVFGLRSPYTGNAFCPTGQGGGQDNSCGASKGRGDEGAKGKDGESHHDLIEQHGGGDWRQKLSPEETKAVERYQAGGSYLQKDLRSGSPELFTLDTARQLDSALAKAGGLKKDVTAYRGLDFDSAADAKRWLADKVVGSEYTDLGYTSTSVDPGYTKSFWRGNEGTRAVLVHLKLPKGTPGAFMSAGGPEHLAHEHEFLIARGGRFRVVDRQPFGNGGTKLTVEYVGSGTANARNAFCPTGPGGGQDNSCGPSSGGSGEGGEEGGGDDVEFYHGTGVDFDEFDPKFMNTGADKGGSGGWYGHGVYLTGEPWKGQMYATGSGANKPKLLLVHAHVSRPFVVHGTGASDSSAALEAIGLRGTPSEHMAEALKARGYDSVVVLVGKNTMGRNERAVNELVVFDTKKLKVKSKQTVPETRDAIKEQAGKLKTVLWHGPVTNSKYVFRFYVLYTGPDPAIVKRNAFCPTGPGGGVDASCSPGGSSFTPKDGVIASPKIQAELDRVHSSFSDPHLSPAEGHLIHAWKTGDATLLKDPDFIKICEKGVVTKDITVYRAGRTSADKALEFTTRKGWAEDTAEASDRSVVAIHLKAGDKALFVPYVTSHHLVEVGVMLPPSTMIKRGSGTTGNSTGNSFCPTGLGGGVDASCPRGGLKAALAEHDKATGKGKELLNVGLYNGGYDPDDPPKEVPSQRTLASGLVTAWLGGTRKGYSPAEMAPVEQALHHVGASPIGRRGEVVTFSGAHHKADTPAGIGAQVRVVHPGWGIHEKEGRFFQLHPAHVEVVTAQNAFCPTGAGGGVDASCSPGGSGREELVSKHVGDSRSLTPAERTDLAGHVERSTTSRTHLQRVVSTDPRHGVGDVVHLGPTSFTDVKLTEGKGAEHIAVKYSDSAAYVVDKPTRGLDVDYKKVKTPHFSAAGERETILAGRYRVKKAENVEHPARMGNLRVYHLEEVGGVSNAFCPTGAGGGQDNSCSLGKAGGGGGDGHPGPELTQDSFKSEDAHSTAAVMEKAAKHLAARWDVSHDDLMELGRENGTPWKDKEGAAWTLLKEWAGSSGGPVSTAAAAAVARHLGEDFTFHGDSQRKMQEYISGRPALARATASFGMAMYHFTQQWLSDRGIKDVTVYRKGSSAEKQVASSWSLHHGGVRWEAAGELREARIPASRVLSVPATGFGTLAESEVVVLPRGKVAHNRRIVHNTRFAFETSAGKVKRFREWLKGQVDRTIDSPSDKTLWEQYIGQGYKKGVKSGHVQSLKLTGAPEGVVPPARDRGGLLTGPTPLDYHKAARDQYLQRAFSKQATTEKVKLLAGRTFSEMEDVSTRMATKMSRRLADGLVKGHTPEQIAQSLVDEVDIARGRALTIAHTELIRAHAEGQLDALEDLGHEFVTPAVEWDTAHDGKVCDLCAPLEGVVLSIDEARGMVPRHPWCRCAWSIAGEGAAETKRTGKASIDRAVKRSLAEGGQTKDDWSPGRPISKTRPV